MYQLEPKTPYAGVCNIKVMLRNINVKWSFCLEDVSLRLVVQKNYLPTSPISGLNSLENSRSKCGGFHRFVIKLIKTSRWWPPSSFQDFLDWNRGCFSLWSSCCSCTVWLKYCCVYPSRDHDSAKPPRKSLSGHPFIWLSKTDKKFSFRTPERLCSLKIFF